MAEEYLIGEFPADENEYNELQRQQGGYITPPTFTKILKTFDKLKIKKARVAIVGRLYTGGRFISGYSAILDRQSIQNAAQREVDYHAKWQGLMNMNQKPMHITGVSIRPIESKPTKENKTGK